MWFLLSNFSIFDKDNDGLIPVKEMRQILKSLGKPYHNERLYRYLT